MTHSAPAIGKIITVGYAQGLDLQGTYIPVLLGDQNNPNLGADGEAVGAWHLRGHLCTGWFRFLFAGTGADPNPGGLGQNLYSVTLPFDVDTSIMEVSSSSAGPHFPCGTGRCRSSVAADSRIIETVLATATTVRLIENARNSNLRGGDTNWLTIIGNFRYIVDPIELGF